MTTAGGKKFESESRPCPLLAQLRHAQKRRDIAVTDPRREHAGCLRFIVAVGLVLHEADPDDSRLRVIVQPVRMKPRQKLIYGKRGDLHIDANNSRPILGDAVDIAALDVIAIGLRVCAAQACRLNLIHRIDTPVEKGGAVRPTVMNGAAGFLDAALAIRLKPYAEIKIRKYIIGCQAAQKMASFDAVHAAEHDIAFRDRPHRIR